MIRASRRSRTRLRLEGHAPDLLTAERSRAFRWLVRAGLGARGLTYGAIGGLAIALAVGAGSRSGPPNQQGALSLIARAPLGRVVLGVVAVSLLAYALWKLGLAMLGHGPEGGGGSHLKDRIANVAGGIAYLGLFALSVQILIGNAGNESARERRTTAGVLGWPGGRALVAIVGAALLAVSIYQIYSAARGGFTRDKKLSEMDSHERRVFLAVGRAGLSARAVVFGLVGYFLIRTAIDFSPSKGIGVDGALSDLHRQTYGTALLAIVAIGLLAFAAFSLFEARYQRL